MKKLATILFGTMLVLSALFSGTSAFAADMTCAQLGRTDIPRTDAAYRDSMDKDKDGISCEVLKSSGSGSGSTSPDSTVPGSSEASTEGGGTAQGPTGDNQAPNGTNAEEGTNGLAATGANTTVLFGGLLILGVGALMFYLARRSKSS